MNETIPIAVIEDDPEMLRFLRAGLDAHGYRVLDAATGQAGLALSAANPAVILLDLALPDIDGLDLIDRLRGPARIPIIVLSSRASAGDKIAALDRGANDYVTKPFDLGELLARIRAALRQRTPPAEAEPVFRSGALSVDLGKREVLVAGAEMRLSPREFALLAALVRNAGMVMTHQNLLGEVWGGEGGGDTTYLRIFVGRLRHKIEKNPARPKLLVTEPGIGYRLKALAPE